MESVQIQNRFKMLFEKISKPEYVMNNYYADGLINKLTQDSETLDKKILSMLTDYISEELSQHKKLHVSVRVFLIRLLAVTSKTESQFTKLFSKQSDIICQGFKDINNDTINPSLRVAYMEVALAIIAHDSGVSWLLETGVWKEILSLCNVKQTVFVVRQIYKFVSKFVWKLNDMNDENNARAVFSFIFKPFGEINLVHMDTISSEQQEEFAKVIEPLIHILQAIVSEVDKVQQPNIIVSIIIKEHDALSHLYVVADWMRNLVKPAMIAAFWLVVAKMFSIKPLTPDAVYCSADFNEITAMYFNTVQRLVLRRSSNILLDYIASCNINWSLVCKDNRIKFADDCVQVQFQLLLMCLIPALVYIKENNQVTNADSVQGKIEEYVDKLLHQSCEHTTRAGYALRDLSLQVGTLSLTVQSVKRLTCIKNHLTNEQANMIFQALFYVLIKYDPISMEDSQDIDENDDLMSMMTYVLDTVLFLVKNHDINWQESIEIICLYTIVYNLLKRSNLSCKFIVTALNVIAVTVKKFLPPNLSLLMESQPGSPMHDLGNLINLKMHDRNWEIRDSALELLLVCTEISFVKFPPFQKQLLENRLINTAATIALHDHESYVQASALKCVGAATKIGVVWDQLVDEYPDVLERLISILRNNQEGIVRKEACCVLREIYQNVKLNDTFKVTLYEHMVSSALTDFHWEVQLSALCFWKFAILSCLNGQGMLDGQFPPVTFSKETRKIVTLNEMEIQKRLIKALDELAQIGCLSVFVKLLHEDTEVEVLEVALIISSKLMDLLNKYKVPDMIKLKENEVGTVKELLCNIKEEEVNDEEMEDVELEPKSDKVIEGILNANDMNLLSNIYERHMNLQTDDHKDTLCTPKTKLLKCASPYLFVNHMKTDFKAIVEQKKKWKEGIRSLSSLLDDVLGIYEMDEEVNTLDCY